MIVAFEYVAYILKQAFKWFPWQLPFFGDRRMLLSVLLDSDQPCNIKGTCFQHCQVMRSSSLSDSPGARREARCLPGCFLQTSKDTPLGGELAQASRGVEELAVLTLAALSSSSEEWGVYFSFICASPPHCRTMLVTCGSPLREVASTALSS